MYDSNRKKQRGQRRKLDALLKRIDLFVPFQETSEEYEHFHVPCDMFIQAPKTYGKIKTAFCKKWLETTEKFITLKPTDLPFCKVVAVIDVPYYWQSQIIIFYSQDYYNTFWNRNEDWQRWEILENRASSFVKARNIVTGLIEKGYAETIFDEEGHCEKSMLWFYGEL